MANLSNSAIALLNQKITAKPEPATQTFQANNSTLPVLSLPRSRRTGSAIARA
ncbi:Uncharacterised protein [Mycobacteroides abscessus subsp. massiliense]|nr:Uncharacterised protein [Mycobacteroides abscessus subsp. massiliense]